MQHIRGRPPRQGRELWKSTRERLRAFGNFFEKWSHEGDTVGLTWSLPFGEIVEAIQTVGGIARMAGVDRSTVYRNQIKAGSFQALAYVLTRKRKVPLVEQDWPFAPLQPGGNKLCLFELEEWMRGNSFKRRRGKISKYHPIGRITVVEICERFRLSRQQFYRWKQKLRPKHRDRLEQIIRDEREAMKYHTYDLDLQPNRI